MSYLPFWEDQIAPKLLDGKNVVIAAHGNSLRALSKYIERISDEDIMGLEMRLVNRQWWTTSMTS